MTQQLAREVLDAVEELTAQRPTDFYLLVTEEQALDLASGYVPVVVRVMARTMLDWCEQDERRAARPVKTALKRRHKGR